ncbi:unnamed protein product [Pleuronectes platessa]|uniref:Uncharacterized protein n=1 Tax=Pleuronectes platessa TaxID=8262 RepID=A0A9N7V0Z5_PLEPL|nr:unnamed protein product [Pleuronectes platessa]
MPCMRVEPSSYRSGMDFANCCHSARLPRHAVGPIPFHSDCRCNSSCSDGGGMASRSPTRAWRLSCAVAGVKGCNPTPALEGNASGHDWRREGSPEERGGAVMPGATRSSSFIFPQHYHPMFSPCH